MTTEELEKFRQEPEQLELEARVELLATKMYLLCGGITDALVYLYTDRPMEAARQLEIALAGIREGEADFLPETRLLAEQIVNLIRSRRDTSAEFRRFCKTPSHP